MQKDIIIDVNGNKICYTTFDIPALAALIEYALIQGYQYQIIDNQFKYY